MMLKTACLLVRKDMHIMLFRNSALLQAFLLGGMLIFLFSLTTPPGVKVPPRTGATIFWIGTLFCQVLLFNGLYGIEEENQAYEGLLLGCKGTPQGIWLGKMASGICLLLLAQLVFLPALSVFLRQTVSSIPAGCLVLLATDIGLGASGSLLGALAKGRANRDSLLSLILFPLLLPLLFAAIRLGALSLGEVETALPLEWLGVLLGFDGLFSALGLFLFPFLFTQDG